MYPLCHNVNLLTARLLSGQQKSYNICKDFIKEPFLTTACVGTAIDTDFSERLHWVQAIW